MLHNDLGSFDAPYFVVTLEPTLAVAPPMGWLQRRSVGKGRQAAMEARIEEYKLNSLMGRWIIQTGYQRSMHTVVWGFGNKEIFDGVSERVARAYGRYIPRFEYWESEEEAVEAFQADQRIHTIYDADVDRVDRLWRMRGHRVVVGRAP